MKITTTELNNHISGDVTTIATCWKLTLRNSSIIGFTDHDKDIVIDNINYKANTGMTASAVANNLDLSTDNMEIEGVLDSANIKEADIQAGIYDFAEISVFMVNYNDLTQGSLNLREGWLGEVNINNQQFIVEVRGLMQSLSQGIGNLYSPSCRAKFGDSSCKVDLANYTVYGTITSVEDNRIFLDNLRPEESGYFDFGVIKFTSGNNNGLAMEVKSYNLGGEIILVMPMSFAVEIGDSYIMYAGCNKTLDVCGDRFSNAINFRGEPHVPGIDKILETSGTRS